MKSFNYPAIFFFCLFLLSAFAGNAQKRPERLWKGGQLDAQIGVGLLSTFVADKARAITPPVTIGGTYLLNDKFSLGLQYGYSSAEKNREILGQKIKWRNNYYTFSLRTGFHYTRRESWDIYGGLAFSHNISKVSKAGSEKKNLGRYLNIQDSSSQFSYTAFLGARYAIDRKMSFFTEVGFLTSIITAGFGYRIR